MKSDHQLCICHGSSVASPSPLREAGRGLCVCLRVGRLMFAVNGALIGASRPGHPAPSCSTFQAASAFGSWPTFLLLAFTLSLPLSLSLFLSVSLRVCLAPSVSLEVCGTRWKSLVTSSALYRCITPCHKPCVLFLGCRGPSAL